MSESSLPENILFHGNGGTYPPYGTITASDHGPAVVVATWIMTCLMGLAIIARFGTRHSLDKDSIAIGVACALSIFQSITVHLAVNYGLGRHRKSLNSVEYTQYNKAIYTSQILKISVYYLAKLSLALVFLRLIPLKQARRSLWLFMLFLTLWAGAAIVTNAIQCPLPKPWDMSATGCINQEALYLTHGIINIFTDLIIILIPFMILWDVQMKQRKKRVVRSIFGVRIVVCITSALELYSLKAYLHNSDKPWFNVDPTIWGQASMNLSIITASIPLMKPLFDELQFGLIDSSIPRSAGILQPDSKLKRTGPLGRQTNNSSA